MYTRAQVLAICIRVERRAIAGAGLAERAALERFGTVWCGGRVHFASPISERETGGVGDAEIPGHGGDVYFPVPNAQGLTKDVGAGSVPPGR